MSHSKRPLLPFFRTFTLISCLLLSTLPGRAQLSAADSNLFNGIFAEFMYQNTNLFPGKWYVHDTVTSTSDLYSKLDSIFVFSDTDFNACYPKLAVANNFAFDTLLNPTFNYYFQTFNAGYLQNDPLVTLDFELNSKKSRAYTTFTPATQATPCDIAFLVIPGSNNNQTSDLMQGWGYHNMNCYIKEYLKQKGDLFVLCKPLEDYRALQWSGKKLNSGDYVTPGFPSFVYNYLNILNKPYGINYMIEAMAMIKVLNRKYNKVIVLGCSQGAYAAMIISLNSPVDGGCLASGYSVKFDSSVYELNALRKNFDTIPLLYTRDVIKAAIDSSRTRFLFTWADSDLAFFQREHDSTYTQQFMDTAGNCTYYYDYKHHAFPGCTVLDTFITAISQDLKARFVVTDSSLADTLYTKVSFCGAGAFTFDLYRDSTFIQTYNSIVPETYIELTDTGRYYIKNISNAAAQSGFCPDTILYKLDAPLSNSISHLQKNISVVNPFDQQILIDLGQNRFHKMELFDATGRRIYSAIPGMQKHRIETAHWPAGIYVLRLIDGVGQYSYKLLKL